MSAKDDAAGVLEIVPMTEADMVHIARIERLAYSEELAESIEVLGSKFRLAPELCRIARIDGYTAGYLLAHPWDRDTTPGLNAELTVVPEGADAVHIHDLALDPAYGGRGIGRRLVEALAAASLAQGFEELTLVAVQGAHTFWERMEFHIVAPAGGYDAQAVFMRRTLARREPPSPH